MAQLGSWVPASYASFHLVTQIFSRMGSDDDIETNTSTFTREVRIILYFNCRRRCARRHMLSYEGNTENSVKSEIISCVYVCRWRTWTTLFRTCRKIRFWSLMSWAEVGFLHFTDSCLFYACLQLYVILYGLHVCRNECWRGYWYLCGFMRDSDATHGTPKLCSYCGTVDKISCFVLYIDCYRACVCYFIEILKKCLFKYNLKVENLGVNTLMAGFHFYCDPLLGSCRLGYALS